MHSTDEVEEIYCIYSRDIYRYLLSMSRDPHIAEDLTQTTFLQIIKGLPGFGGRSSLKTWIFTIARHEYLRWLRKNPETLPLDESWYQTGNFTDSVADRIQYREILTYINHQEEPHRSLLSLRLIGDFSYREIGLMLGRTENWCRVTFMRDKRRLIEELKEVLS